MTKKEMYMVLAAVFEASTQESYSITRTVKTGDTTTTVVNGEEITTLVEKDEVVTVPTKEITDFLTHEVELLGRRSAAKRQNFRLRTTTINSLWLIISTL
jgi:hypothetical protein